MSWEDLPVLTGLTALALGLAVLHLEDGSSVTVGTEPNIWLPSEPPFVLGISDGEHRQMYTVPDHLHATVRAALNLRPVGAVPLVLTLTGIDRHPNSLTFQAMNEEGQAVALSVPCPVSTQTDFLMWPLPQQVGLIVSRKDTAPNRAFRFEIQPETLEGRAVLELLGYGDRVEASWTND